MPGAGAAAGRSKKKKTCYFAPADEEREELLFSHSVNEKPHERQIPDHARRGRDDTIMILFCDHRASRCTTDPDSARFKCII